MGIELYLLYYTIHMGIELMVCPGLPQALVYYFTILYYTSASTDSDREIKATRNAELSGTSGLILFWRKCAAAL